MSRNATLREVQLVQLEIAREIKRVCEENGIRYFLDSGTLLGAVRHKGFIPWDDDLDIGMLRFEYEKFLKIAPGKLGKDYELQTWHSEPGHGYAFSKVRKKGTLYVERICEKVKMPLGIYVDILPYDVFPAGRMERFFQGSVLRFCRGTILMKCGYTPWAAFPDRKMQIMSRIKYLPFRAAALVCRKDRLVRRFEKTAVRYNGRKPEQLMEQAGASSYGKWVVPASCLSSYSVLPFEGEPFSCPGDPDLYLSTVYGDYMTPPPENKRGNRHQIVRAEIADE